MEARRKCHNIFQRLKEKNCQLRILHPVKLIYPSGMKEKPRHSQIKENKDILSPADLPALKEWLQEVLETRRKQ